MFGYNGCAYFAGVSGGIGVPLLIAAVVIIVGCVIIKRKRESKQPGGCSKLITTAL